MRKILLFISVIFFISCNSKVEDSINKKSTLLFDKGKSNIKKSNYIINIDSFQLVFDEYKNTDSKKAFEFANRFHLYSSKLLKKREKTDSVINKIRKDSYEYIKSKEAKDHKIWLKTKAGKIYSKHPEWSKEDCESLSKNKVWIGMTYEMLLYSRGKPNRVNTSNYGNGNQYQCCWDKYNPSCFYMKSDNIIYSYN